MTVPKVGDILMLSQKALKIGRAFASCHKNAPSELQSVETEIGDLAKALRLLAETLHAESEKELFQCADQKVQDGIGAILFSCQRTVDDLDSLVDQYQVIKKHRTVGGFAIERSWTDLVLKSSTRLKSVVTPTVERTDITYHANATLDRQIDQVHRIVQDLTLTPQDPQTPPIPPKNPARSPTTETPNPRGSKFAPFSSPRHPNNRVSLPRFPQHPISPNQPTVASLNTSPPSEPSPTETISMARTSDSLRRCASRTSDFSFGGSSIRYSSSSYASSEAGTSSAGWQSPAQFSNDYFLNRDHSTSTKKTTPLPRTPEESGAGPIADNRHSSLHSLPVIGLAAPYELQRTSINISQAKLSPFPSSQPEIMKLHRSATTTSQKTTFEREAFRNSAVLCDVRGRLVEYSHCINQDDPHDVEMLQASDECRIAVIRKRITDPESRIVRVVTSIWAFSDDNLTRVELRMEDDQMYIPYSSYFSPSKVSITMPCELKFHDIKHGNRPVHVARTSWVNYIFDTPQAAALFQNEIMGRTLLATFRTEQTLRSHTSLVGKSFSYAEQMCGMENLRVWEDNDSGAIIALIHFSAHFRQGYLAFYLNDAAHPVKVKDDGGREVKIKGLRVPIEGASRKDS
ncbi:UbiH, 2-polyprenyl-6-methoxyphenol hydroxylase, partial [Pyrenophora tritici-repentis]